MAILAPIQIDEVLKELYHDSRFDKLKMLRGATKSIFRPMEPEDFEEAYLAISEQQGQALTALIKEKNLHEIVEFGTSFGISTLHLAKGALQTGGQITTTELIPSKARKAVENFERAGVSDLIEVRVGNALETLRHFSKPIDLLLLDGWKNLYLPLFRMLESNFHPATIIYVDNAEMADSKDFLNAVAENERYHLQPEFNGKVVIITIND